MLGAGHQDVAGAIGFGQPAHEGPSRVHFKISDERPELSESMREAWEEFWEEPYS